nr:MAG TPA: hypothetical protein [Caudoviricetes sp.]DAR82155.1 MAG TPA: hypothetical protein [Caudoviricetes sp.]
MLNLIPSGILKSRRSRSATRMAARSASSRTSRTGR